MLECLKDAIKDIEEKLMISISKVIASVPAYYSNYTIVNGEIDINNEDNKINGNDIVRVLQNAVKSNNK